MSVRQRVNLGFALVCVVVGVALVVGGAPLFPSLPVVALAAATGALGVRADAERGE